MRLVARRSSGGVSRKPLGSRASGPVFLFDLAIKQVVCAGYDVGYEVSEEVSGAETLSCGLIADWAYWGKAERAVGPLRLLSCRARASARDPVYPGPQGGTLTVLAPGSRTLRFAQFRDDRSEP